jgi:hypothetical protein
MDKAFTKAAPPAAESMDAALAQWETEGGTARLPSRAPVGQEAQAVGGGYDLYVWRGGYCCFLKTPPTRFPRDLQDGESSPGEAPWFRFTFDKMPVRLFGVLQ